MAGPAVQAGQCRPFLRARCDACAVLGEHKSSRAHKPVAGRHCEKWATGDNCGTTTIWFDRKLSFPIKKTVPDGFIWQLTDITEAQQDACLYDRQ
jgi:hypothetical protein